MGNMRGERERQCLDIVKSLLNCSCYYGMSEDDCMRFENAIQTAQENLNLNAFPDFVFEHGFIEHFEVTSSHSNRNGSTLKIEQHCLQKEAEVKEKALIDKMNETPCYEGKAVITDKWHSKHSYDDFCLSFKKKWEKHIDSLEKYTGDKNIGIFMVQYNDSALVLDVLNPDVKTELYYDDLLGRPKYRGYRFTYDSTMLNFIYPYKDKIEYVAFFNNDVFHGQRCEIICVKNIPEILKLIKGKCSYHCAMIGSAWKIYGISSSNPLYKGSDENE